MPAAVLPLVVAACYSYVPITPPTPRSGAEVRLQLALPGGDFALQNVTIHGIVTAEGRVLFADGDSVVVAASRVWSESGSQEGFNVGVTFRQSQITDLREKRVSGVKTALALAAGGAAVAAIIAGVGPLAGSGRGRIPPEPPP